MKVTVGTFNLNNLFSRFNFKGVVDEIQGSGGTAGAMTVRYEFTDADTFKIRTFTGKLVKEKKAVDTERITSRILEMDVDVLAVQEVENIEILNQFNDDRLGNLYPHRVLVEGNDPRFIDVALLSKLPLGAVSSYQKSVHPSDPGKPVFGRDLLEVEVWSSNRTVRLFTIFNNHLKSHFVHHGQDEAEGQIKNDARREKQAEMVATIVAARTQPGSRYIILGDMNDPPDSTALSPMVQSSLGLVNALADPEETREPKPESIGPGPQTTAWTYRHKATGEPPEFNLYDQIWLSPALSNSLEKATIDRRERHGGDGSDHDPAWVELAL